MSELNPWQQILDHVSRQSGVNLVTFDTWLKPCWQLPGSNGTLFIRVPNAEFRDFIEETFHDKIVDAIRILKLPVKDIEYRPPAPDPIPEIPRDEDEKEVEEDGARHVNVCPTVPEAAWYGIAKQYRAIVGPCTEASDNYHLASFLTLAACGLGKSVFVNFAGEVYPNMYVCLVGDSAWARKSAAMRFATWMALEACPYLIPLFSVDSSEGLTSAIQRGISGDDNKKRGSALVRLDEFNGMLSKAAMKGSSIIPALKCAFDCPPVLQLIRANNWVDIQNPPAFSLLAGSETDDLSDISERDIKGGFSNRIIFVPGKQKSPNAFAPNPRDDPRWNGLSNELKACFKYWHERKTTLIQLSPKAKLLWSKFYLQAPERGQDDPRVGKLTARHASYAAKIALIFATLSMQEMIHEEHLEAAISFIDFCLDSLYFAFRSVGLKPWVKDAVDIIDYVKFKGGSIAYWDLYSRFRRLGPENFERQMKSLVATQANPNRHLSQRSVLNEKSRRYKTMVFLNR